MQELTIEQTDEVAGGLFPLAIPVGLAIFDALAIAYDCYLISKL